MKQALVLHLYRHSTEEEEVRSRRSRLMKRLRLWIDAFRSVNDDIRRRAAQDGVSFFEAVNREYEDLDTTSTIRVCKSGIGLRHPDRSVSSLARVDLEFPPLPGKK